MPSCDALVFDLDGTLVDTLDDITASARHAVASISARTIDPADVRPWVSHGARDLLAHLSGAAEAAVLDRLVARFREHYRVHGLDQSRLYDGWPAVLDALTTQRVPLAVLSNKPDASTQAICAALLKRWPFRAIVGLRDGLPPKPDPAGLRALVTALGIGLGRVGFVGDSPFDMQAALAAGCHAIGVGWGFHSRAELEAAGATVVLGATAELLQVLQNS